MFWIFNINYRNAIDEGSDYFTESILSEIPFSVKEDKDMLARKNESPLSEIIEKEQLHLDSFDSIFMKKEDQWKEQKGSGSLFKNKSLKMSTFSKKQSNFTVDFSEEVAESQHLDIKQDKGVGYKNERSPLKTQQKKRGKRRDVIFKKILRECRRFYSK